MDISITPVSATLSAAQVPDIAPRSIAVSGGAISVSAVSPPSAPSPVQPPAASPAAAKTEHAEPAGLTGMIDRIRADFDAHRSRIVAGVQPNTGGGTDMTAMVNHALRAQVEIFDTSIVFHAGLTVSQQSQNGVKTLIEKG